MSDPPQCPDCRCDMERGFIPDFSWGKNTQSVYQTCWYPGDPEDRVFLGFRTGAVEFRESKAVKITAYRCPQCGLMREYARAKDQAE